MATMDKSKFAVDMSIENITAKILVLATGQAVAVGDAQTLFDMYHNSSMTWGSISQTIEAFMNNRMVNFHNGDLSKTFAEVIANATGESWSENQIQSLIVDYTQSKGIDTWTALFAHLIENNIDPIQSKLDSHVLTKIAALDVVNPPIINPLDVPFSPDIAATFINPANSSDAGLRFLVEKNYFSPDGTPLKSFSFDAPLVKAGMHANKPYIIYDFAGGDKTLSVTECEYIGKLGIQSQVYFVNFQAGDKLVLIDDEKSFGRSTIDGRETVFNNVIHSFNEGTYNPYDPKHGIDAYNKHLVYVETQTQPFSGKNMVAPLGGIPAELNIYPDGYGWAVNGLKYNLNLLGEDIMDDGAIVLVGTNPYHFDSGNFIINSPEYTV